ncbi:dTDP-4-deoxyrhamnose-3,5-epimerase (fragment) [Tenacibaculum jejuense]|uniref:dTDP-4-dehydrorhamnose 3,5-epimerase n=1 Tax=Tenacibaculum jejuense TaxID=584609 RepID=A0A238U6X3_9FLAO
MMNFIKTKIPDLMIIEPKVFGDQRGYFFESFNVKQFEEHIFKVDFVQDNESRSSKGVLRGLHFQKPPYEQAKLVRCVKGSVLDVAVDIRRGSPTFGAYEAVELSEDNKRQLFVQEDLLMALLFCPKVQYFLIKLIIGMLLNLIVV